jgi:CTP:molybdopterin cytidylyltransferase MocA/molybdenum-dependent DNA-binding transcriptional regulator ModE
MTTAALIIQGPENYEAAEEVAGKLPLRRLILTFKLAGINRVIVAGDKIMYEAEKHATKLGAEFIYTRKKTNKRQFSSYSANAIDYLSGKCDRVLVVPANYPLFDIKTVERMLETDAEIAVPVYKGVSGYPLLISDVYFDDLLASDGNFTKLVSERPLTEIDIDDEGIIADVTTGIDAEAIAEKLTLRQKLRPVFKLGIAREKPVYGAGIHQIVRLTEETGALLKAQKLLGMAQSYKYKLVNTAELGLGFTIREHGGVNQRNGGSALTNECREFADKYDAFTNECEKLINEAFKRYFGDE